MSKDKYGVGRVVETGHDQFTVQRVINHPELIFNQRPDYDDDPEKRFFRIDAASTWQFQNNDDCLMCNRFQYTQIHY